MGRYAFFNTGVEYKFSFGVQSSYDILEFGGYCEREDLETEGEGHIEWTQDDLEYIDTKLKSMEEEDGLIRPDITQFKKTVSGTSEFRYAAEKANKERSAYFFNPYILGLIIFHQLQYTDKLTAKFEL